MCAPLQLYLLNSSLGSAPTTYAVPCYQALLVLWNACAGGVFFHEFAMLTPQGALGMGAGFVIAVAGIGALSLAAAKPQEGEAEASSTRGMKLKTHSANEMLPPAEARAQQRYAYESVEPLEVDASCT